MFHNHHGGHHHFGGHNHFSGHSHFGGHHHQSHHNQSHHHHHHHHATDNLALAVALTPAIIAGVQGSMPAAGYASSTSASFSCPPPALIADKLARLTRERATIKNLHPVTINQYSCYVEKLRTHADNIVDTFKKIRKTLAFENQNVLYRACTALKKLDHSAAALDELNQLKFELLKLSSAADTQQQLASDARSISEWIDHQVELLVFCGRVIEFINGLKRELNRKNIRHEWTSNNFIDRWFHTVPNHAYRISLCINYDDKLHENQALRYLRMLNYSADQLASLKPNSSRHVSTAAFYQDLTNRMLLLSFNAPASLPNDEVISPALTRR